MPLLSVPLAGLHTVDVRALQIVQAATIGGDIAARTVPTIADMDRPPIIAHRRSDGGYHYGARR
jgi:hypothetical protein